MGRMLLLAVGLLAVTTDSDKSMMVAQWIWNIISGLAMVWVALKVREFADLKKDVSQMAEKMVDLKLLGLTASIEQLTVRLNDTDGELEHQGRGSHSFELKLKDQTSELQRWMLENFSSKKDLEHLEVKVDSLADKFVGAQIESARAGAVAAKRGA